MDFMHDVLQFEVDLLPAPGKSQRILRHFQTRNGDPSCIGGFSGPVEDIGLFYPVNRFGCTRHIGSFGDADQAIVDELPGIFLIEFILSGTRKSYVTGDFPGSFPFKIFALIFVSVFVDPSMIIFQIHDKRQFFIVDSVRIVDGAVGIRQGYNSGTQFVAFLKGVLSDVSGTGDGDRFPADRVAFILEHFFGKINQTIPGSFRYDQTSTKFTSLAGQYPGEGGLYSFVLSKQIPDFPGTYPDITGGYIDKGSDVPV